jgi:hypothetical protein
MGGLVWGSLGCREIVSVNGSELPFPETLSLHCPIRLYRARICGPSDPPRKDSLESRVESANQRSTASFLISILHSTFPGRGDRLDRDSGGRCGASDMCGGCCREREFTPVHGNTPHTSKRALPRSPYAQARPTTPVLTLTSSAFSAPLVSEANGREDE